MKKCKVYARFPQGLCKVGMIESIMSENRRGKETGMIAALCVFMVLPCLLFLGVGIVWELVDCIVRKLEKDGCL